MYIQLEPSRLAIYLGIRLCTPGPYGELISLGLLGCSDNSWTIWSDDIFWILTLIVPGEVKVDLANFYIKFRTKFIYIVFFQKYLFLQKHFFPQSFWTPDMTSKNDILMSILTFFVRSPVATRPCQSPPSVRFYCYYRTPEHERSHPMPWSASGAAPVNIPVSFWSGLRRNSGGRQILSQAQSLTLSNWTAGTAPFWAISWNHSALWHT
jgi:hypothetical protein